MLFALADRHHVVNLNGAHIEGYALKVLKHDLGAGRVALYLERGMCRDLAETLGRCSGLLRIEDEARAAVGLGDPVKSLLGTRPGAIQRATAWNRALVADREIYAESTKLRGLIDGIIQNVTIGTVLAALFECVRDHHHLIDGVLFGLADHMSERAIMLRPPTLVLDFRYRPRDDLRVGEPLRGLHFVGAAEKHDLRQTPRADFFEHRIGDGARSLDHQLALGQVFA